MANSMVDALYRVGRLRSRNNNKSSPDVSIGEFRSAKALMP